MAADIEKYLVRPYKKDAFITTLYESIKPRIILSDQSIQREDLELQIYIACIRGLHVNDEDILGVRVLQLFFPEWKEASYELIDKIAHDFEHVHRQIQQTLHHRLGRILQRKIKPSVVAFRMLEQVYEDKGLGELKQLLAHSDELEQAVKQVCAVEYKKVRKKLARNVFRSIIYLFLTKVILAVVIEVPFDLLVFKEIHYLPLLINVLVSPFLLMLIGFFTQIPDRRNTANILMELKSLLRDSTEREVIFEVKRSYQRSTMLTFVFRALYFFAFVVSFGAIIQFLLWLHFNVLSGVLFVVFLSLVSYFGIRIKKIARDLSITNQRENILTLLLDFFSYPVVSFGQYLSQKWSKFNVLAMVFDVIIEAPLKILVEIMEEWFSYFDEKKEELY
jgi:ABC-type multidrug transport system fused ATPase/permease subunit